MTRVMMRWELIEGGVRKHFSWGYSEIYAATEDCFTKEELIQVVTELHQRKQMNALGPEAAALYGKLQKKLKGKV